MPLTLRCPAVALKSLCRFRRYLVMVLGYLATVVRYLARVWESMVMTLGCLTIFLGCLTNGSEVPGHCVVSDMCHNSA